MTFTVGKRAPPRGQGEAIKWLRDRVSNDADCCFVWPFSRVRGYGKFGHEGKLYYAHRFMCELAHGPAPTPKHQAAHSCGNGHEGCVNPKHISWKTPSENQRDRNRHGTKSKGRRWKLTADQVSEIRALHGHLTHAEIAIIYGCTRENIGRILRGNNWQESKNWYRQFSDAEVAEIRRLRGVRPLKSLAEEYGTSISTLWRIQNGRPYTRRPNV